jgi:hypothetical protein
VSAGLWGRGQLPPPVFVLGRPGGRPAGCHGSSSSGNNSSSHSHGHDAGHPNASADEYHRDDSSDCLGWLENEKYKRTFLL